MLKPYNLLQVFEILVYVYVKFIPNPSTITLIEKFNDLQGLQKTFPYSLQVYNHTYPYRTTCTRASLPSSRQDFWFQPIGDLILQSYGYLWCLVLIIIIIFLILWGSWGVTVSHFLCRHIVLTGNEKDTFGPS